MRERRGYGWLLGESLIIVLGVLIALAADRAIQGLDQAALETSVLEGLLSDLQEADSVLQEAYEWAVLRDGFGRELLAVLDGRENEIDIGTLVGALEFSGIHYPLRLPRGAWDDLNGTGQLGVVTNESLRRAISRFFRSAELIVVYTEIYTASSRPYADDVRLVLPARARLDIRDAWVSGAIFDPASDVHLQHVPPVSEVLSRIRRLPDFAAHLSDVLLATTGAAHEYSLLRDQLESVLRALQAELDAS
jgi:hypothetical protein